MRPVRQSWRWRGTSGGRRRARRAPSRSLSRASSRRPFHIPSRLFFPLFRPPSRAVVTGHLALLFVLLMFGVLFVNCSFWRRGAAVPLKLQCKRFWGPGGPGVSWYRSGAIEQPRCYKFGALGAQSEFGRSSEAECCRNARELALLAPRKLTLMLAPAAGFVAKCCKTHPVRDRLSKGRQKHALPGAASTAKLSSLRRRIDVSSSAPMAARSQSSALSTNGITIKPGTLAESWCRTRRYRREHDIRSPSGARCALG